MIWCFPHFFFPTVYHNWYFSTLRFTYFALVFTFPTLRLINANASHCNLPARIICLFFTGWRVWHCSIFDPRAAVPDSCTEWPSLHSEVGRPSVHLSGLQATLYGWGRVVTTLLRPASHPLPPPSHPPLPCFHPNPDPSTAHPLSLPLNFLDSLSGRSSSLLSLSSGSRHATEKGNSKRY